MFSSFFWQVRRAAAVLGWQSMASRGHGPCLTYTPACGGESCSDVPTYAESMSLMAVIATTAAAAGGLAQCQVKALCKCFAGQACEGFKQPTCVLIASTTLTGCPTIRRGSNSGMKIANNHFFPSRRAPRTGGRGGCVYVTERGVGRA